MTIFGLRASLTVRRIGSAFALAFGLAAATAASPAFAQAETPFGGGFKYQSGSPIEVNADSLEVRNKDGVAVFTGNVRVKQGEVLMKSRVLEVTYGRENSAGAIEKLRALGGVVITNGKDSAEARRADYNVASGVIVLRGKVLLVQCPNAIAGPELQIDLNSGRARMKGKTTVRIGVRKNC